MNWNFNDMSVTVLKGKFEGKDFSPEPVDFEFELADFQKHTIDALRKGHNAIVSAHTGSGKSVPAYWMCGCFHGEGRTIYTAPIKSLSNQKLRHLREKFPDWSEGEIGLMTGDVTINEHADVMVMTTEILRNKFYSDTEYCATIRGVVLDEVHYIKDKERGTVWEEVIITMPKHVQFLMLSATLPGVEKFAKKVARIRGRDSVVVPTEKRIVPLTYGVICGTAEHRIMDNDGHFYDDAYEAAKRDYHCTESDLDDLIKYMQRKDYLPANCFCFNRRQCKELANRRSLNLLDAREQVEAHKLFEKNKAKIKDGLEGTVEINEIEKLLMKGIGYHHGGMAPLVKELVETLDEAGLVKVNFVTETYAAGVDMPKKSSLFLQITKFDGTSMRNLLPEEFFQLAGRCGRRGKDTIGRVFINPLPSRSRRAGAGSGPLDELKKIMTGPMSEFNSQFKITYRMILLMIVSGNDPVGLIKESMFAIETEELIERLTSELNTLKEDFTFDSLEDLESKTPDEVIEYHKLEHDQVSGKQGKIKKLKKKMAKTFHEMTLEEKDAFDESYRIYDQSKDAYYKIMHKQREVDENESYISDYVNAVYEFLVEHGYLMEHADHEYTKSDVTRKGIIASRIGFCNELLMAEIITNGLLDDLTLEEILSLLGIFIEERATERETEIPHKVMMTIRNVKKIANNYEEAESYLNLSDWTLHSEFCDIIDMWVKDVPFTEIHEITRIAEGNFVKSMLKLRGICNEVVTACEVYENDALRTKMEGYIEMIVKKMVTADSLHLK